jgi:hypothetical protein
MQQDALNICTLARDDQRRRTDEHRAPPATMTFMTNRTAKLPGNRR